MLHSILCGIRGYVVRYYIVRGICCIRGYVVRHNVVQLLLKQIKNHLWKYCTVNPVSYARCIRYLLDFVLIPWFCSTGMPYRYKVSLIPFPPSVVFFLFVGSSFRFLCFPFLRVFFLLLFIFFIYSQYFSVFVC